MTTIKGGVLDLRHGRTEGGSYQMPGKCSNCGWAGTLILRMGQEAPRGMNARRCDRCGCKTVRAAQ